MGKKALFFDFDGTLWFGKYGDKTIQALKKVHEQGDYIFLNTGRSQGNFEKGWAEGIPFDGLLFGGAHIVLNGKDEFRSDISREAVKAVIELSEKYRLKIMWEGVYENYRNERSANKYDHDMHVLEECELLNVQEYPLTKFDVLKQDAEEKDRYLPIRAEVEEELSKYFHVIQFDDYIELIQKGLGKNVLIEKICEKFGIPKEDRYAFGDSRNDLPMFSVCGNRVAIGHAPEELKREATFVTTEEENGVAEAIYELKILEGEL